VCCIPTPCLLSEGLRPAENKVLIGDLNIRIGRLSCDVPTPACGCSAHVLAGADNHDVRNLIWLQAKYSVNPLQETFGFWQGVSRLPGASATPLPAAFQKRGGVADWNSETLASETPFQKLYQSSDDPTGDKNGAQTCWMGLSYCGWPGLRLLEDKLVLLPRGG
jgi:hypothetical protein